VSQSVRFIVVRHAESVWNQQGILQGQLESPTSARGLRQIDALLGALKDYTFSAVISSPSQRALTTARAIAQHHSAPLHLDSRLHEQHLGRFQALTATQIRWPVYSGFYMALIFNNHLPATARPIAAFHFFIVRIIRCGPKPGVRPPIYCATICCEFVPTGNFCCRTGFTSPRWLLYAIVWLSLHIVLDSSRFLAKPR